MAVKAKRYVLSDVEGFKSNDKYAETKLALFPALVTTGVLLCERQGVYYYVFEPSMTLGTDITTFREIHFFTQLD